MSVWEIIMKVFWQAWQENEAEVLQHCQGLLPEEHDIVMGDWRKAETLFEGLLQAKTSYWLVLPWLLCALAHPDPDEVRKAAIQILTDYDARPPEEHHRLANEFCNKSGELRAGQQ